MERLAHWVAYRLPNKVLYYAIIRVWAKATTTKYQDRTPDSVNVWEALKTI